MKCLNMHLVSLTKIHLFIYVKSKIMIRLGMWRDLEFCVGGNPQHKMIGKKAM